MDLLGWWNPPPPERARPALTDAQLLSGGLTTLERISQGALVPGAAAPLLTFLVPGAAFLRPVVYPLAGLCFVTFIVSIALARRADPRPWYRLNEPPDPRVLLGARRRLDLLPLAIFVVSVAGLVAEAILDPHNVHRATGIRVTSLFSLIGSSLSWLAVRHLRADVRLRNERGTD